MPVGKHTDPQIKADIIHEVRELGLPVNPRSNVVVPAAAGLHFLGHAVTSSYAMVDKHTSQTMLARVTSANLPSYQALALAKSLKRELYWRILDENVQILDKLL